MFGVCPTNREHPGLIARAVKLIFDLIESRSDTVFVVKCTFVELHLDNFNNLLDHENHPSFKNKQLPNWYQLPATPHITVLMWLVGVR